MTITRRKPVHSVKTHWLTYAFFGGLGTVFAIMHALGKEPKYSPRVPYWFAAVCCSVLMCMFWKRFDFYEEGIVYSRCAIIQRPIRWSRISQIVVTTYGAKSLARPVLLFCLDTVPECDRFRKGDDLNEFIRNNMGRVFVCEWDFHFSQWKDMDEITGFIEQHWGKIQQ